MKENRIEKINKVIIKKLSFILKMETINLKNNIITITKIKTTNDLSLSKIYISTFNNDKKIIEILNNSSKNIRHKLSKNLNLYKIPKLLFIKDESETFIENIKKLLQK